MANNYRILERHNKYRVQHEKVDFRGEKYWEDIISSHWYNSLEDARKAIAGYKHADSPWRVVE